MIEPECAMKSYKTDPEEVISLRLIQNLCRTFAIQFVLPVVHRELVQQEVTRSGNWN